jgi:hypothetical protein
VWAYLLYAHTSLTAYHILNGDIGMEQIEKLTKKKHLYLSCFIIFGIIAITAGIVAIFKENVGQAVVASFNIAAAIAAIVNYTAIDLKIEFLTQIETLRNEQK